MRIDPDKDWSFATQPTAEAFDAHVREQLPWYEVATRLVADIARHYITRWSTVYDIGAATGNIGRSLAATLRDRDASLISIEAARSMAQRFEAPGRLFVVPVEDVAFRRCSLAVSFLTLIFLDVPTRALVLSRLCAAVQPGGALVLVERMLPDAGYVALVQARSLLMQKIRSGAPLADVAAKELTLAGVQRPLDVAELPVGSVEFFRAGPFVGTIWEKQLTTCNQPARVRP